MYTYISIYHNWAHVIRQQMKSRSYENSWHTRSLHSRFPSHITSAYEYASVQYHASIAKHIVESSGRLKVEASGFLYHLYSGDGLAANTLVACPLRRIFTCQQVIRYFTHSRTLSACVHACVYKCVCMCVHVCVYKVCMCL